MNMTSTPATITHVVLTLEIVSVRDGPLAPNAALGTKSAAISPIGAAASSLRRMYRFLLGRRSSAPAVAGLPVIDAKLGVAAPRVFGRVSRISGGGLYRVSKSPARGHEPGFGPLAPRGGCLGDQAVVASPTGVAAGPTSNSHALLGHRDDCGVAAQLGPPAAGRCVEVVQEVVCVQRVVVEEEQPACADAATRT